MELKLYNTLTREKALFIPRRRSQVDMYVCGITPYSETHIGHARTFVFFDTLRRFLESYGFTVLYVQNVTDVEDKIINQANKEGIHFTEVVEKYFSDYLEGMDNLGVKRASFYPKVSDHIPEIIEMIEGILRNNCAYIVDGNVYFSVSSFSGYGKLSGQSIADMQAGARIEVDPLKRDPLDFALWKKAKHGEPFWDSPWGKGRPGWHIECSTLSFHYLRLGFDIHGGGRDLVFPHHENEIAQTESFAQASPMANWWVHCGPLRIKGEKMSKSLGNIITLKELFKQFSPLVLRAFFLMSHYRSPLNFSLEQLTEVQSALSKVEATQERLFALTTRPALQETKVQEKFVQLLEGFKRQFAQSLLDDLNTAVAMGEIFKFSKDINSIPELSCMEATLALSSLTRALSILGIDQFAFPGVEREKPQLLDLILEIRQQCREQKMWSLADGIRKRLSELGIFVEDLPGGKYRYQIK